MKKVEAYIEKWKTCGYPDGIPDEVPNALMRLNLAPSWKAIAIAILQNDLQFTSLGFSTTHSKWYDALKKIEIDARNDGLGRNMELF